MISKKLKERLMECGLSEGDVTSLEEEFDASVDSKVDEIVAGKEKVLEEAAEKFADEKTEEAVAEKTEELTDAAEKDLTAFKEETEDKLVESLDKCVEMALQEIKEEIGDAKKQAMLETYEPIINGVKALFEQHGLTLDVSGAKRLEKLEENLDVLEKRLNKSVEENIYLKETNEKLQKENFLVRESGKAGLSVKSFQKLETLCETLSFEDTQKQTKKYLDILMESEIDDPEDNLDDEDEDTGIKDGSTADDDDLDNEEELTETKKFRAEGKIGQKLSFRELLNKKAHSIMG